MSEAANQYLYPDSAVVYSPSGQFRLQYQGDGNLVLVNTWSGWTPVWSSGTSDHNPGWVAMQGDGNFVIYNGNSQPVWSTGTQGNNGAYLFVADNGSLVLFSPDGSFALWWSAGLW
jgi:hypothetical protein